MKAELSSLVGEAPYMNQGSMSAEAELTIIIGVGGCTLVLLIIIVLWVSPQAVRTGMGIGMLDGKALLESARRDLQNKPYSFAEQCQCVTVCFRRSHASTTMSKFRRSSRTI